MAREILMARYKAEVDRNKHSIPTEYEVIQ